MSLAAAREAFDELTRQQVLERRFAVLVRGRGRDEPPGLPAEIREVFGSFEARLCTFPELEPLLAVADRVLVLSDGVVFHVVLQRLVLDGAALSSCLPLERLVELAAWFTTLTGSVGGSRMPVVFQVQEVHPAAPGTAWLTASRGYRRRGVAQPRVGVYVTALDAATGACWTNAPGLAAVSQHLLVRRAWRERRSSEAERRRSLAHAGFQPTRALLGAGVGAALGVGVTALLLHLLVRSGEIYGGAAILASGLGALVGLKSCRVCRRTVEQAVASGLLAFAGIVLGWGWLGLRLGPHVVFLGAMAAAFSLTVGFVADPRRGR